jgi:hypothetical protein
MIPTADVSCAAEEMQEKRQSSMRELSVHGQLGRVRVKMPPFVLVEVVLMGNKRPPPDRRRHGGVFNDRFLSNPALSPPPAHRCGEVAMQ